MGKRLKDAGAGKDSGVGRDTGAEREAGTAMSETGEGLDLGSHDSIVVC